MSYTRFDTAGFGPRFTGLSTVGYRLYNSDNTPNGARLTAGIAELAPGSGVYGATITFPDVFAGFVAWDDGAGAPSYVFSAENFDLADFGPRFGGLATVGYQLFTTAEVASGARITAGVVELVAGLGVYGAAITYPDAFVGYVRWDDGAAAPTYLLASVDLTAAAASTPAGWPSVSDVAALLFSAGLTVSDSADVAGAIDAAVATMELQLGRSYTPAAGQRRYDGLGVDYLPIEPCSAITAVELLDGTGALIYLYPASDWQAHPLNQAVSTGLRRTTAWAGTEIGASGGVWGPGLSWPRGKGNIRVSATFGQDLPADVFRGAAAMAALELAGPGVDLFLGGLRSWTQQDMSETYGPDSYQDSIASWQALVDRAFMRTLVQF